MAITSYSELVSALQDYSLRSDAPFDILIGNFESSVAPFLIHYRAETSTIINIPTSTKTITIPNDFQKLRAIFVDGKVAKPISIFDAKIYPNEVTYYQTGNQIVFNSIGNISKANIVYYGRCPALTLTQTTNWLLEYFPNIYLFGVLAQLYHWARDEEAAASTQAQFAQSLQQLAADQKQYETIANPMPQEVTVW